MADEVEVAPTNPLDKVHKIAAILEKGAAEQGAPPATALEKAMKLASRATDSVPAEKEDPLEG